MICRMFGTFEAERSDVKIVYGLVDQPQFWNPVWHQVSFFYSIKVYLPMRIFSRQKEEHVVKVKRELLIYHPALLRCHPVSSAVISFIQPNAGCPAYSLTLKVSHSLLNPLG